jgi:peptidyl-prolyl cis-trans isomerase A (cyclophilin A)
MKRAFLAAILAAVVAAGAATASGGPTLSDPSSLKATAPATFNAKFVTTQGSFVISVTRAWSPKGADRFYNLVLNHFYDNQPLFRVIPGRYVQWGIHMTPKIAKVWKRATIKDDKPVKKNAKWKVTFANAGANTRTTQIFVNLGGNFYLDKRPGFSPFGEVTQGMSVFPHLYHGYGEGPSTYQSYLVAYGGKWVHHNYPKLDWITTARIVS